MSRKRKYTDKQFIDAVASSTSISQVLTKVGLAPQGGNYASFRRTCKKLNVNTSHFTGQGWNKGRKIGPRRPIEDYLSNKQSIQSYKLKQKLLDENLKDPMCESCGLMEWFNDPIPLELDHIDGNNQNNSLDNLRLLCPNCHALTPTYRGKNHGKYSKA